MSLVRVERDGAIALLWLDNPPLNLVSAALTRELDRALQDLDADRSVRAVIVTAAGRAFCAGSNIREFPDLMHTGTAVERKLAYENEVFDRMAGLRPPTIAAIQGLALGGGAELSLCCDYRIMAEETQIGFPEVRLGTMPGSGGVTRLPRLIGSARALALMWDGDPLTAERAAAIGLVDEVVPLAHVLERARERARHWAEQPARAVQSIKRAVLGGMEMPFAEATQLALGLSDDLYRCADMDEGVRAFLEKRAPRFSHE